MLVVRQRKGKHKPMRGNGLTRAGSCVEIDIRDKDFRQLEHMSGEKRHTCIPSAKLGEVSPCRRSADIGLGTNALILAWRDSINLILEQMSFSFIHGFKKIHVPWYLILSYCKVAVALRMPRGNSSRTFTYECLTTRTFIRSS